MAALSPPRDRLRRRRVRKLLFLSFGVIGLLLFAVFRALDLGTGDSLASVLGLFVGLAGLLLSLAEFLRGAEQPPPDPAALADDLARTVRAQWLDEASARRLRDPRVLPLAWAATRREVADRPAGEPVPAGRAPAAAGGGPAAGIPGARAARVLRVRLDGRLDGRFEEATARLAAGYRQIDGGRLVVLGEPGAGKSVLAMLLTLGLLAAADRGEPVRPVPVLVPVSSWDPVVEGLDDWLVRTLAGAYYAGRPDIPRTLLAHGLLLPVLDGLDEIPESARRGAVRALNRALGTDRPVVVTCRSAEYEDVIEGGSPALRRAPVVEIAPVAAADAIGYLSDADWPAGTDWEPVFGQLREEPGGPVALALSTPLMISVARSRYERSPGRPAELADPARFPSRHAVEDHLMERFVDAAYADLPDRDAARARAWLASLALYLHRHREQDLAWWLMPGRLFSAWTAAGVGLGLGILLWVFTGVLTAQLAEYDFKGGQGAAVGGCFALLAMIVWFATADRRPGRPAFTVRGAMPRLRRGFRSGLAFTAVPAVAVLGALALVLVSGGWGLDAAGILVAVQNVAVAVIVAVSCALAVCECLDAPPGQAARSDPSGSLREDRNSALTGAPAAGAVVALLVFPVLVGCSAVAAATGAAFNGWRHEPGVADLLVHRFRIEAERFGATGGLDDLPVLVVVCCVLPGLVTALLTLLTRAWTRFTLLRLAGAVRGRLPWRLMGFLADAHRRGVLRQSGGLYRFRHVRIQETLVPAAAGTGPQPATAGPRRRRALGWALAAALVPVGALLAVPPAGAFPPDTSRVTLLPRVQPDHLWFEDGQLFTAWEGTVERWDAYTGDRIEGGAAGRVRPVDLGKELFRSPVPAELRALAARNVIDVVDVLRGTVLRVGLNDRPGPDLYWHGGGHPVVLVEPCSPAPLLWDVTARRVLGRLPALRDWHGCQDHYDFSGDRTVVADLQGGYEECAFAFWDLPGGRRRSLPGRCNLEEAAALSHDGRLAAVDVTFHEEGEPTPDGIHVVDTRTGHLVGPVLTGHLNGAVAMAFDRSGRLLAVAASDGVVRIWELPR
ncbi:hypothetical protein LG634_12155 [Streptomyces bambusae]|uniref:hypothetical protein n=1 Tax=Streptomyces bambusae TaxID=1550616 RepID=UPI001CFDA204|nr:hypothetical protein [Streptomyces bambusae]MCB5165584.1 hypothetical protein [Streptomyces bambusae]